MTAHINYQIATEYAVYPSEAQVKAWINAALEEPFTESEVTVRIVDENEAMHLNRTFRDKDYATNVLSFAFAAPEGYENILGDIVLCAPVILKEAEEQHKNTMNHWAHLVVHGTLHLQGYDHLIDEDAEEMETREAEILAEFNIANPYQHGGSSQALP